MINHTLMSFEVIDDFDFRGVRKLAEVVLKRSIDKVKYQFPYIQSRYYYAFLVRFSSGFTKTFIIDDDDLNSYALPGKEFADYYVKLFGRAYTTLENVEWVKVVRDRDIYEYKYEESYSAAPLYAWIPSHLRGGLLELSFESDLKKYKRYFPTEDNCYVVIHLGNTEEHLLGYFSEEDFEDALKLFASEEQKREHLEELLEQLLGCEGGEHDAIFLGHVVAGNDEFVNEPRSFPKKALGKKAEK